ncbi:MAG TPA: YbaB/EbfC family nucleoid-associated protein [Candidatus Bathyarchaeia archaeon]|nr:YbaB/EbfC family nucleoid-associated protein [Candidatus Bathyarchaeia archaeon]
MFDKLKQLNDLRKLRSQALQMQQALAQEIIEIEEAGIKVVVRGDQRIEAVEIAGQTQDRLVEILNKAIKQAQQKAAAKLTQMSGGLGGLLGQ